MPLATPKIEYCYTYNIKNLLNRPCLKTRSKMKYLIKQRITPWSKQVEDQGVISLQEVAKIFQSLWDSSELQPLSQKAESIDQKWSFSGRPDLSKWLQDIQEVTQEPIATSNALQPGSQLRIFQDIHLSRMS